MISGYKIRLVRDINLNHSYTTPWVGYSLEGYLLRDMDVGARICLLRTKKNDWPSLGIYVSNPILKLEADKVHVADGVWKLIIYTKDPF